MTHRNQGGVAANRQIWLSAGGGLFALFVSWHCLSFSIASAQNVGSETSLPPKSAAKPATPPQPPLQQEGEVVGVKRTPPAIGRGQRLQFVAAPLSEVIELYQVLIGKRIIRDPKLENQTVTIETSGVIPPAEAVEFIEKSLLLAGYAFVPSGNNMLKILGYEGGRIPASEGLPMILSSDDLPRTDQVVSFLLKLQHLDSEEAAQAFAQIIPPHPYGKITPVPDAKALVINENSSTIRAYIELGRQVDVPPDEVKHKSLQLERADAEEVAAAIGELLGLGGETKNGGGIRTKPAGASAASESPRGANRQTPSSSGTIPIATSGTAEAKAVAPKLKAIQRTNSILVIGRPLDIQYIESLVAEFDAAASQKSFISRRLRYLKVTDFIDVARNALLRGSKDEVGPTSTDANLSGGNNKTSVATTSSTGSGRGGLGTNSQGSGFGSGGFGTSGGTTQPADVQPKSTLIGKTLVIADPSSSEFYASGPPEQLRMLLELADELDKRPRQILLTAVIGEFTLGNDYSFGVDWIRTMESVGTDGLIGGSSNASGASLPDFTKYGGIEDFASSQGLAVYGRIGKHLNVFLNTLEQNRRFHLLQKPTVTALNHEQASIYIGQQLAIAGQSLTSSGTTSESASISSTTEYVSVRLQIDVTPHIYANDEVRLDFSQQNMDVSGYSEISGNQVPNLTEQGMKNSILVPDRSTVLLGGLITERDSKNKNGLPLLVRIPVLKHLFGNSTRNKERRELMVFVQPQILKDNEDYRHAQGKWAEGARSFTVNRDFADGGERLEVPEMPSNKRAKAGTVSPPTVKLRDPDSPSTKGSGGITPRSAPEVQEERTRNQPAEEVGQSAIPESESKRREELPSPASKRVQSRPRIFSK